jgi:tRNA dimethylallyltransferase
MLPLIILAGPTASGKTALAIALARRLDGEVISADSRQVYKRCDIVTAKPTPEERAQAPHQGLDLCEPHQAFSAAQWARHARERIREIHARGAVPIVCGGTGFYIRALVEPAKIPASASDPVLHQQLGDECEQQGLTAMHARLQVLAPERAARIHPNDRYRVLRALEIALSPAPQVLAAPPEPHEALDFRAFRLEWPREALYERIDSRVDAMAEEGAWRELQELLRAGVPREAPALNGVGYRQMLGALDESHAVVASRVEAAMEEWKRESRRYAKRQETWFRHQLGCAPLNGTRGARALAEEIAQSVS